MDSAQRDLPQVPVSGAAISREVYQQIVGNGLVSDLQKLVVVAIDSYGPMTANEVTARLNVTQRDCVRPRLTELKNLDVVEAVSKRKCSVSGKVCLVWSFTGRPPTRNVTEMVRCPHCNGKGKVPKAAKIAEFSAHEEKGIAGEF